MLTGLPANIGMSSMGARIKHGRELKDKTTADQRPVLPSNSSIVNDTTNIGKESATVFQRPALPLPNARSGSDRYNSENDSGSDSIRRKDTALRRPSSNHNDGNRMHDDRQREHDQHAHRSERR